MPRRDPGHKLIETKTTEICVGVLASALLIAANATSSPVLVDEKLIATGKIDIRPDYPAEAQAQRLTGSGVFILHIDSKSGSVKSVQVEKSTGHKMLDDASITAFSNLRFRPNGVKRVIIPVTFTLPPETSATRVTRNFPATWLAESNRIQINSGRNLGRK